MSRSSPGSLSRYALLLPLGLVLLLYLTACGDGGPAEPDPEPEPEPQMRSLSVTLSGDGAGTVTSTPAGISCTAGGGNCSASFAEGTQVSLAADADAGHEFAGWGGACSGGGSCALTVAGDAQVTASFNDPTVVAHTVGSGGATITSEDGDLELVIPEGALSAEQEITIATLDPDDLPEELQDLAEDPGILAAWELGPDGLSFDQPVVATLATGLVPDFEPLEFETRLLLLQDDEWRDLADAQSSFLDPETGELMVRGSLRHFSWIMAVDLGVVMGVNPPQEVTVGVPFEIPAAIALYVAELERSSGRVISNGTAYYMDASTEPLDPQFENPMTTWTTHGTDRVVHLAQPGYVCTQPAQDPGADFGAALSVDILVSGGDVEQRTVNLSVPEIRARIACVPPPTQTLTVLWEGDGSGHVTSSPAGIDCASGSSCSADFEQGTEVALTAVADDGSAFCGWTGGNGQTQASSTIKVTMDSDGSVTACFEPVETTEVKYGLDYRDVPQENGKVAVGEHTVDLLDAETGEVVGQAVVKVEGDVFIDADGDSGDHLGFSGAGKVSLILHSSTFPAGTPPPDQGEIEIRPIGNDSPDTILCRVLDQDGNTVSEQTHDFGSDTVVCRAGPVVEIEVTEGFAFLQPVLVFQVPST